MAKLAFDPSQYNNISDGGDLFIERSIQHKKEKG
jgi:hypothetical protein